MAVSVSLACHVEDLILYSTVKVVLVVAPRRQLLPPANIAAISFSFFVLRISAKTHTTQNVVQLRRLAM